MGYRCIWLMNLIIMCILNVGGHACLKWKYGDGWLQRVSYFPLVIYDGTGQSSLHDWLFSLRDMPTLIGPRAVWRVRTITWSNLPLFKLLRSQHLGYFFPKWMKGDPHIIRSTAPSRSDCTQPCLPALVRNFSPFILYESSSFWSWEESKWH